MAPFNNRQIGYIQAIAGRQQHVTLISGQDDNQFNSVSTPDSKYIPQALDTSTIYGCGYGTSSKDLWGKSLYLRNWSLDGEELAFDARADHNNDALQSADFNALYPATYGLGQNTILNVFQAPCKGTADVTTGHAVTADSAGLPVGHADKDLVINPNIISSVHRATTDGFLNSTTVKFRFTLPTVISGIVDSDHPMKQDHYEFRWIVWRNKRPTMDGPADDAGTKTNLEQVRDGASFRHPGYDFFKGQTGRKRGLIGYTFHPKLDSDGNHEVSHSEKYSGKIWNGSAFVNGDKTGLHPTQEAGLTVDDLLTLPINRDDYVVMKDVRFFLGKEHGKSHFEDSLHWDWNDPIDTPYDNVLSSPTLNNKNYRWHMTLIGTSNGSGPAVLNHSVRWTTKMESG